jgi:hypothetical protein
LDTKRLPNLTMNHFSVHLSSDGKHLVNEDGIPIVIAELSGTSQLSFWCPYCRCRHFHGRAEDLRPDHRLAHCHVDISPFHEKGYILVVPHGDDVAGDLR